jgi:hypothetical protein
VANEEGAIEQSTLIAWFAGTNTDSEVRQGSVSAANGPTAVENGVDPNSNTQPIGSPTVSPSETLVADKNASNDGIPNRFNSVQPSSYAPTEAESTYTSNTGGRARYSAFANLWRSNSSDSATITTNGTTVPELKKADMSTIQKVAEARPVVTAQQPISSEPAVPATGSVTAPDGAPQSFFDSDSDSGSDRYQSPILSEATVSEVTKPALIEHKSFDRVIPPPPPQRNVHGFRTATSNPGPSMSKASQILGAQFKNLHDLTPAIEKGYPLHSHPVSGYPALLVPGMHAAAVASNYARNDSVSAASTIDMCGFADMEPPSPQLSFTPSSVVEAPPIDEEALDTLPSPQNGLRVPPTLHSSQQHQPLDTLGGLGGAAPKRATSAPPFRRSVRINTDDFVVKMGPGGKRFYRESVVSTPYPTRSSSLQDESNTPVSNNAGDAANTTNEHRAGPMTGAKATHPSFEKTSSTKQDTLTIRLTVSNHPLLTRTVSIPLHSPASPTTPTSDRETQAKSYDDDALFTSLRKEYYTLIGPTRRFFLARKLANISYHGPGSTFNDFDTLDFLSHFTHPSLGKKRRKWILFVRNISQSISTSSTSRDGLPYPLMPYLRSTLPSFPSGTSNQDIELASYQPTPLLPCLEFSHKLHAVKILLAVFLTLILSVAAVLLWTFLGLPRSADVGVDGVPGWHNSASRLETGLVLGFVVAVLWVIGMAGWVGVSGILL